MKHILFFIFISGRSPEHRSNNSYNPRLMKRQVYLNKHCFWAPCVELTLSGMAVWAVDAVAGEVEAVVVEARGDVVEAEEVALEAEEVAEEDGEVATEYWEGVEVKEPLRKQKTSSNTRI